MISQKLLDLDRSIYSLSYKEKLWLLERIARQLRELDENELLNMASDSQIQAEITSIEGEFAVAELDGLHGL
jgi:hypothetical protein